MGGGEGEGGSHLEVFLALHIISELEHEGSARVEVQTREVSRLRLKITNEKS